MSVGLKQDWMDLKSYGNPTRGIQLIRKAINESAIEIKSEIKLAKEMIGNDATSFSSILQSTHYPIYIYKNEQLVYWNNHKFIPDRASIKKYGSQQLLASQNGKFILFREQLKKNGDRYEIFSLLRLTYRYPFTNEYLRQGVNAEIFPSGNVAINSSKSAYNLYAGDGTFLFSINFGTSDTDDTKSLICFLIGLGLLITAIGRSILWLKHKIGFEFSLYFLVAILTLVIILLLNTPDFLLEITSTLFGGKGKSDTLNSINFIKLGGISMAILCLIAYIFRFGLASDFIKKILRADRNPHLNLLILIVINGVILGILYQFMTLLYAHEATSMAIQQIFYLGRYKILAFGIFSLLSINYFLCGHLVSRYIHYNSHRLKAWKIFGIVNITILISSIVGYFYGWGFVAVAFLSMLYLFIIHTLNLSPTLGRIRYITYIYFFTCAMICSLTAAIGYGVSILSVTQANTRAIAQKVVREEKLIDEKLFYDVSGRIGRDKFIRSILRNPLTDKNLIEQKIKMYYLTDVMDKYEIRAYLYDNEGRSIDENTTRNYFSIYKSIDKPIYKTAYSGVFRQRGVNSGYFCPIIIRQSNGLREGYILLEIKLRKVIPYSIFPALLIEKSSLQMTEVKDFSYAIYDKGRIISSFGDYNYFKNFKELSPEQRIHTAQGIILEGKYHQLVSFADNREVLVSTDFDWFTQTFSNFSFLFLILALLLAGLILSNTFYYKLRQVSTTFTTKIQLFINFAFFIPLVVVSIAVFYIISFSYRKELKRNFINKAEAVCNKLLLTLNDLGSDDLTNEQIEDGLNEAARFSQTDMNLYDTQGRLLLSTQPKFFEYGILSNYINPLAVSELVENKETYALLEEQIGALKFNTVYYKIKSYSTGEVLGTLAIPFFGSDKEIQDKILEALMVVLNVFTVIFILFLIASFFASRLLTAPLSLLTNKIKQTSLNITNEPLIYNANDEIGLLVNEYNRMLLKLDESKKALSASEKEAAWREMARQVAHEIKNPLTPMKLTLQNLQRIIKADDSRARELTERSIATLLDQVDNLSDIAGSFSAFTQMPVPKRERFEIATLLKKSIFLFEAKEDASVSVDFNRGEFYILGDEKLMGRILINLITNAFEAVQSIENPQIKVSLKENYDNGISKNTKIIPKSPTLTLPKGEGTVGTWIFSDAHTITIEIADNGEGISTENKSKVFQPNFSTKTSGSGIGLAVAKRGIEQMGGKIWFETSQIKGTSFFIEMMLAEV